MSFVLGRKLWQQEGGRPEQLRVCVHACVCECVCVESYGSFQKACIGGDDFQMVILKQLKLDSFLHHLNQQKCNTFTFPVLSWVQLCCSAVSSCACGHYGINHNEGTGKPRWAIVLLSVLFLGTGWWWNRNVYYFIHCQFHYLPLLRAKAIERAKLHLLAI